MRRWKVKRYVVETFEVWAATRQDALDKAEDPHRVEVIRETAKPLPITKSTVDNLNRESEK